MNLTENSSPGTRARTWFTVIAWSSAVAAVAAGITQASLGGGTEIGEPRHLIEQLFIWLTPAALILAGNSSYWSRVSQRIAVMDEIQRQRAIAYRVLCLLLINMVVYFPLLAAWLAGVQFLTFFVIGPLL